MLNYKKLPFYLIITLLVIIIGRKLAINQKTKDVVEGIIEETQVLESAPDAESTLEKVQPTIPTEYNKVKIEFLSEMMGYKASKEFESGDLKIIAAIEQVMKTCLTPVQDADINNNHTNRYTIELSNDIGGYSSGLYYDTLYDKAYIIKDGGPSEVGTDFARYIDSLLENTSINTNVEDIKVIELFEKYQWTIDYQISTVETKLGNIDGLSAFIPVEYYFAYNNELSKDIYLDMSVYPNDTYINIEIYRLRESMPKEFYPVEDARGIVIKKDEEIIGAFISSGRHSTFIACSLKGNSFETATGLTINEWFAKMIKADSSDESLAKLGPQEIISRYFNSLDQKDAKAATYCISKKSLLENLTSNMENGNLFNEVITLPLTNVDIGTTSIFDNLKSAKLLKIEPIQEPEENTKVFKVSVNLKYKKDFIMGSGDQDFYCNMVYESPQTGWKVEGFGH